MALLDFDNPTTWESLYEIPMPDGSVAHYERRVKGRILGRDHWALAMACDTLLDMTKARVLIVGAGFGWVAEDWLAMGVPSIACVDTSAWIAAHAATEAVLPILTAPPAEMFDLVVTEDVMPCLSDDEARALAAQCRQYAPIVVHWATCPANGDPRLNWKTPADWKTLLNPDAVVSRGTGVVL